MLRICVVAAATLMFFSSSASAQSSDTWSGFSVALGGGASHVDTDALANTSLSNDIGFGFGADIDNRIAFLLDGQADNSSQFGDDEWSGFGTVQAAFDQRFGKFVIGAFVDLDFYPDGAGSSQAGDLDGSFSGSGLLVIGGNEFPFPLFSVPVDGYASYSASVELDKVWTVGGKLGYLVNEKTLIYAVGGYSEASVNGSASLSFDTILSGPQTLNVGLSDELHGYMLGGGGEYKFTNNLALRLEYRYAKYSSEKSSASFSDSFTLGDEVNYFSLADSASLNTDIEAEIHSVRAALVMKLGMP